MQGIYPNNFEIKIGFDKIRELLNKKCLSSLGRDLVDEIIFLNNRKQIELLHSETEEFFRILQQFDSFPTNNFYDVRPALNKIRTEGRFLEIAEVYDLKRSLETVRSIVTFFNNQEKIVFPVLKEKAAFVQVYPYIYTRVDAILSKTGKIRDNATPELSKIRRTILSHNSNISKRLHAILKKAQSDGWVDEGVSISVRDGRSVIPISSSNKRKLSGIVYDESATGKTSYIEPNEIVEMNNELMELENAERREIIKILVDFSTDIRPYIDDLNYSYQFLGEIDFIRSKASLAIDFDAIKPEISETLEMQWNKAVHPLLMLSLRKENREIVPLNIALTQENHIVLISGPNAGGKSVCLKTMGLLQYMLQCGLLIPVEIGSQCCIFTKLFIDIGDEQSIENDLSTYSSHLMNMKYFLRYSDERTLVLIDEFGTGTEPMLGGAIAEAILNELNTKGTFGIITTHYTNLKHFASSVDGIENGAMLYDSHKMNPLFQLEIGKPGSSFAFEIAKKIGLPESILEDASNKVGKKHIDYDKNLKDIVRDKRYWEGKRQRIRKVEKTLDGLAENYETELLTAEKQRKEIIKAAKEEAAKMLADVNKKIENTISEIRKSQAEKEKTRKLREEMELLKKEVKSNVVKSDSKIDEKIARLRQKEKRRNERRQDLPEEKPVVKTPVVNEKELEPGDKVRIIGQETIGELMQINAKNAVVAFGQLITTLPRNQVERISNNEAKKAERGINRTFANVTKTLSEKKLNFKSEIDIRGQRVEEALATIQEFIDEAIMLDQNQLRILHGKGNGILKETIREYLRTEAMVKSFKDEHVQFGGSGITIVNLSL